MKPRAVAATLAATLAVPTVAQQNVLETVTIIGSREDARGVAGSGAVITAEDIARFQDTDIQRILSQVPGVYFREEDGYGLRPNISIRGSYGDRSSKITLYRILRLLLSDHRPPCRCRNPQGARRHRKWSLHHRRCRQYAQHAYSRRVSRTVSG